MASWGWRAQRAVAAYKVLPHGRLTQARSVVASRRDLASTARISRCCDPGHNRRAASPRGAEGPRVRYRVRRSAPAADDQSRRQLHVAPRGLLALLLPERLPRAAHDD